MANQENPGLNASLAGLLRIEETQDEWSDADLAAIWRHQLGASLAEQFDGDASAAQNSNPDISFNELFQADRPSLERLQQVKRFAKSESGLPREAAGVLYLLAIGVARLRLEERISETEDSQLAAKLQWAAGRSWVDAPTKQILKACAHFLS